MVGKYFTFDVEIVKWELTILYFKQIMIFFLYLPYTEITKSIYGEKIFECKEQINSKNFMKTQKAVGEIGQQRLGGPVAGGGSVAAGACPDLG